MLPNIYTEEEDKNYYVALQNRRVVIVNSRGIKVRSGCLIGDHGKRSLSVSPSAAKRAGVRLTNDGKGEWDPDQAIQTLHELLTEKED